MLRLATCVVMALGLVAGVAQSEPLKAVSASNLSPFSRGTDEPLPGFVHEYTIAVAAAAGYEIEIEYMPWKRAQELVQTTPGLLIFGVTRNEAREKRYSWVTNMLTVERVFLSTGDPVNGFDDAMALRRIAARSVYFRALDGLGWTNIEEGETHANFKKLKAGRVDAVFTVSARAVFVWTQELGYDRAELVVGEGIDRADIWLAASMDYPADVIARLNEANARLRADGTYAELYKKYFGELPIHEAAQPELLPSGLDG